MKKTNNSRNIPRVEGLDPEGFGIMPKLLMEDKRLSKDAKVIYAYFKSYDGEESADLPPIKEIMLHIGFKKYETFKKHFDLLVEYGYIKVKEDGAIVLTQCK